jgi:DNA repair exonuclease SbcCD ATPase subunit
MSIKIRSVSMRNFLSVGAVTQSIDLNRNGLTLVLGDNLDLGGNGSRNGVGKSTILQAISYGLYGEALTNIRRDNLVNKINGKNMVVSVEFDINGQKHRIERGRKPQFFRWIVDDERKVGDEGTDEAQGDARDSQKEICQLIGMSHALFKHIVALNTYTEPFLSMGAAKQREIIEELLGITLLSQKAENLKELIKATKVAAEQEEFRIRTIKTSNQKIKKTILDLQSKIDAWDTKQAKTIMELQNAIYELERLDIDQELVNHEQLSKHRELDKAVVQLRRDLINKTKHANQLQHQLTNQLAQYEQAINQRCPTCQQNITDHDHQAIAQQIENNITALDQELTGEQLDINDINAKIADITSALVQLGSPVTWYDTLTAALNHKNSLDQLCRELQREQQTINPYLDQADSLTSSMQPVEYDDLNALIRDREHQEFLLKLLTNKDSFIRKRVIDQNLAYLNTRLNEYLDKLGLPHTVRFLNDLTTEISLLGQDLDYWNLSRGESTRVILSTSLAFRDIFENANQAINLLFMDELLDNGLDPSGIENVTAILKKMQHERNKNIFVISHRDELQTRVDSILTVTKTNSFTHFSYENDVDA